MRCALAAYFLKKSDDYRRVSPSWSQCLIWAIFLRGSIICDLHLQELHIHDLQLQDLNIHKLHLQDLNILDLQDLHIQELHQQGQHMHDCLIKTVITM